MYSARLPRPLSPAPSPSAPLARPTFAVAPWLRPPPATRWGCAPAPAMGSGSPPGCMSTLPRPPPSSGSRFAAGTQFFERLNIFLTKERRVAHAVKNRACGAYCSKKSSFFVYPRKSVFFRPISCRYGRRSVNVSFEKSSIVQKMGRCAHIHQCLTLLLYHYEHYCSISPPGHVL